MNTSDLLTYCMSKPGAEQSVHSDWKATQIKSDGILFAMVHEVKGRPAVSLKATPALAELLREEHNDGVSQRASEQIPLEHAVVRRLPERFTDLLSGWMLPGNGLTPRARRASAMKRIKPQLPHAGC